MTTHRRNTPDADGPWTHENPRAAQGRERKHLTPAQKASAKRNAKAAGRPYPQPGRQHAGRPQRKSVVSVSQTSKDPEGGLTAAGRAGFRRTQGANLKPGVTKPVREMTLEEMRRKGAGPPALRP